MKKYLKQEYYCNKFIKYYLNNTLFKWGVGCYNLNKFIIEMLCGSSNRQIQYAIASNEATPSNILDAMLNIDNSRVKEILAKNPNTSPETLFKLAKLNNHDISNNILNNLQTVAKDYPTVMFFPGEYSQINKNGSSLELFGKLHDDNYYRAFNIHHYEI